MDSKKPRMPDSPQTPPAPKAKRSLQDAPAKKQPKGYGSGTKKNPHAGRRASPATPFKAQTSGEGEAAQAKAPEAGFFIVGIGASAGGLEALDQFFSHFPSDNGMAFVVISHLSPGHVSVMPELIRKYTGMEVFQIESDMRVRPNCVYVTPPSKDVAIMNRTLRLMPAAEPRGLRLPINSFLRSLAHDAGDKAIAVILSGSGSDGTSGIKEIKAELGLVVVQDPVSAKYDGMPRSAIATGIVDYIMPTEKMPEQLLRYVRHVPLLEPKRKPLDQAKVSGSMQEILIRLRDQTGHDFSFYKKNTIHRRIERRMNIHQIDTIANYASYLQRNPHELKVLFQELLIGVTSFFRDPEAFETLKGWILARLVKERRADDIIRVWVPGCSTGEEAYSLAIIFRECLDEAKKTMHVQVFGTDIDLKAIEAARAGIYSAGISADLSPERLARFFTKGENTYQVRKELRELVIFAPQNVIKDPPFIKLDLLSCRNLLIYLETEVQKKIIPLFHYALRPGGILFLGSSETVGEFPELFSVLDKKWRVFARREQGLPARAVIELPPLNFGEKSTLPLNIEKSKRPAKMNVAQMAERLVLENFAPPTVIVNQNADILYVHGRTGDYLEPAPGEGGVMNLLKMSREGLRLKLMAAFRKAKATRQDVALENVEVVTDGRTKPARVIVKVLGDRVQDEDLIMVVFQDLPLVPKETLSPPKKASEQSARVAELERELQYNKEYLQGTIEELETSNEELMSANEELQSTNEELQSTNEELETSQEELQSLNEEHVTLNAELQGRIDELSQANNDMKNLLESTDIATIFLDNDLRITRFTSPATKIINLISTDVGRPLTDIVLKLCYETLIEDAREVLRTLVPKEREVRTKDGECGRWYLMRMKPYRTVENVINGLVLTFVDINEQKTASAKAAGLSESAKGGSAASKKA